MAKSLADYVDEALKTVPERTWDQVARMEGWLLMDVREPEEFEIGHVPGAVNFPRGMLEVRADLEHPKRDERLQNRDQRVICYCGGGVRSALAAKTLLEMGFTDAVSVKGGWTEYEKIGALLGIDIT